MAGQEHCNILVFMRPAEIRRCFFIEGDGAGQSPDLLRPEEHHQGHHQP
jgi:hypothetical protein